MVKLHLQNSKRSKDTFKKIKPQLFIESLFFIHYCLLQVLLNKDEYKLNVTV